MTRVITSLLYVQTGWSAVMLAIKNSHEDLLHYLTENGCDLRCQREVSLAELCVEGTNIFVISLG